MSARTILQDEERYGTRNYAPLPVILARGRGVFVWDLSGRRYFDMLSAYSALSQGHNHPAIVAAAKAQMSKLSLCSRAFHSERLGPFLKELCGLTRMEKALPMNSGAEAVETAIKAMRLWGYRVKNIPRGRAKIVVCAGNFHGRTTTIVGFSSDRGSREGFGPATPGFVIVPYGDEAALRRALRGDVCGFLVEPIQGEAGVLMPPRGYLAAARRLCSQRKVLLCVDEIQTGLGRTGRMFCADYEGVRPDLMVLGKALSGGLYPVSALVGKSEVMGLFTPGTHGSTFGGNPLACAIGLASIGVLKRERLPQRARTLGAYFLSRLRRLRHPLLKEVRGKGLLLAVEFREPVGKAFSKLLMKEGILAKDTHGTTVRFAPPLVITRAQIDAAFPLIERALAGL